MKRESPLCEAPLHLQLKTSYHSIEPDAQNCRTVWDVGESQKLLDRGKMRIFLEERGMLIKVSLGK
jgi:hypothetical protein